MEWLDLAIRLFVVFLALAAVAGGGLGAYRSKQVPALQRDLTFEREQRKHDNEQRERDNEECQRRLEEMRSEYEGKIGNLHGRIDLLSSEWLEKQLKPAVIAAVREATRDGNGSG